jgi:hypothetical protein
MRLFYLDRTEDVSGTSGIGRVAEGCIFDNDTAVLVWLTQYSSTAVYRNIDELEKIHSHNGKTKIVYLNQGEY